MNQGHHNPGSQDPDAEAARTARFWDTRHKVNESEAHDNFLNHPLIQAYVSLRAFGNLTGHLDAVIAEIRTRTTKGARILSLGCGPALKEMAMATALPDRIFVASDIAEGVVAAAQAEADRRGLKNLELQVGDFNRLQLKRNDFEIITMLGALHHVEALESFWEQCRLTLREGGVVLAQEYVGPSRMQWTKAQIESGDLALQNLIPASHKVHHDRIVPVPMSTIIELDPSEAVRSAEILSSCAAAGFVLQGYASAGCALLQPVLMYQTHTFDPRNWEHNHVLMTLFREEDRLMREGMLSDDFAMFIAAPH